MIPVYYSVLVCVNQPDGLTHISDAIFLLLLGLPDESSPQRTRSGVEISEGGRKRRSLEHRLLKLNGVRSLTETTSVHCCSTGPASADRLKISSAASKHRFATTCGCISC